MKANISNNIFDFGNKKSFFLIATYIIKRVLWGLFSLFAITFLINSITFLTPPRERALLIYGTPPMYLTENQVEIDLNEIIEEFGFDNPISTQFKDYLIGVSRGNLGFRSIFGDEVLTLINARIPVTLELVVYSILLFIPGGILFGAISGWRENKTFDVFTRFSSFFSFSIPPFILSIIFLSIFYVSLGWFMPGRLGIMESMMVREDTFIHFTKFLSIDGFLNQQPEISMDAIRRLVMPVIALSISSFGTILLITRKAMINIKNKDFITSAFARGLSNKRVLFKHALRNAIIPGLTTSSLLVTSMLTELYIIERVFNRNGISELLIISMVPPVNIGAALGFALYNFIFVSIAMFIFDIIINIVDPLSNLLSTDQA